MNGKIECFEILLSVFNFKVFCQVFLRVMLLAKAASLILIERSWKNLRSSLELPPKHRSKLRLQLLSPNAKRIRKSKSKALMIAVNSIDKTEKF